MKRGLTLVAALAFATVAGATPIRSLVGDPFGDFLPVEQAFQVDARGLDARTVSVRWVAAPEYYLYRDKFRYTSLTDGVTLGTPALPDGKMKTDEFFGTVEVYYGEVEAIIPVTRAGDDRLDITLELAYQGCADAGLCYPPDTRTITVRLPSADEAPYVSDQDRLAGLLADGEFWWIVATFYGLGLLLTFTPCVLPMVPILSGIIIGQGPNLSARRGLALSLVYVLAMAVTYTAAGVFAALAGHNLQAAFQHPAVLVVFAGVFVLFALAMFGVIRIQVPAVLQARLADAANRQRAGTWIGVAVMGFLSALIVGPCVAAPLAGALIYIARTGDAVLGGSALFAMSLGMGTLLLVIGASAGKLVPKAGPYMNAIKAAFGVLMLGVAIWLIERIVPALVTMVLWAALAAGSGLALFRARGVWKAVGLLLTAWGLLILIGAAAGGRDPLRPLVGSALTGPPRIEHSLEFKRIKSLADLETELAGAAGRAVMLDFYADWCVACKEMERDTFPYIEAALGDTVLLQADVTANDATDKQLMRAFGILGPPSIVFFGPDGDERRELRVVGFMPPERFTDVIERARKP